MSQIKELDNNEKLITTLAIIAGLIFFALALVKCNGGAALLGINQEEPMEVASENITDDLLDDKLALEEQMRLNGTRYDEELKALKKKQTEEVDLLNARIKELEEMDSKPATIVEGVAQSDYDALSAELAELRAQTPSDNSAEIESLKAKITSLERNADALALEKDKAVKIQRDLQGQIQSLSASSTGDPDSLKAELAKADKQWKNQISQLKVNHEQELAKLRNANKAEINKLRNMIRSSKAQKVFATSADDLAPAAKGLISSLEGYKGTKAADLNKLYNTIGKKQNAKRKLIVNFASGSDSVSADDQAKIKSLINKANNNSYFVAVGYADPTGSASANKDLSSRRATNVAKVIKPSLNDTQFTQAYYLGQTSRFGADENNRVVEIWEITE